MCALTPKTFIIIIHGEIEPTSFDRLLESVLRYSDVNRRDELRVLEVFRISKITSLTYFENI